MDEILSNVPPYPQYTAEPRYSYVVVGKPGCGKSTLAAKLAQYVDAKLITTRDLLQQALNPELNPHGHKVADLLWNGNSVGSLDLEDLIKDGLNSSEANYKGIVYDAISCLNIEAEREILNGLVKKPGHFVVLIQLHISDDNLMKRRAGHWIDPVTNDEYPGQQVLYSKRRRAEGYVDGVDEFALKEHAALTGQVYVSQKEKESEEEEASEHHEESAPVAKPAFNLKNRISYPILSESVIGRLIKCPADDPLNFQSVIQEYKGTEDIISKLRAEEFDMLKIIDIDATQHPDLIFDQLKTTLLCKGFSIYNPVIYAKKLPPFEGQIGGNEIEIWKHYENINVTSGAPCRIQSMFAKRCPVSYYQGAHNETDMSIASSYKNRVYFFHSSECQEQFSANPEKFVCQEIKQAKLKIFVLGGAGTGKTIQSHLVAKKYDLIYLSFEEALHSGASTISKEILTSLKNGESINPMKYANLAQELISAADLNSQGWVMDGFLSTSQQLESILTLGINPSHIIGLSSSDAVSKDLESPSSPTVPLRIKMKDGTPNGYLAEVKSHFPPGLALNAFKMEFSKIALICDERKISCASIDADRITSAVFSNILCSIDSFINVATPAQISDTGANVDWGHTKTFCPVTLLTKGQLVSGNREYGAKFENRFYILASEEARTAFLAEPYKYLRMVKIPPPRLIIMGCKGSGKKTIGARISGKWGIPVVSFSSLLALAEEKRSDSHNLSQERPEKVIAALEYLNTEEPYKSNGYILLNFPIEKSDLEVALKSNLLPDAFISLKTSSNIGAKRSLAAEVSFRSKKYKELLVAKQEFDIQKQQLEAAEVEQAIKQNPHFLDTPLPQSESEIFDDLCAAIDKEIANLNDYGAIIESLTQVPLLEIPASSCMRPIWCTVERLLEPFLNNRRDIFSSVKPISEEMASFYISDGIKSYSKLGKLCPVTLQSDKCIGLKNIGSIPVEYENHIIFLKDQYSLNLFIKSPSLYLTNEKLKPMIFPTFCIVGNPKSGKTTLSKAIAEQFDLAVLTIANIIVSIMESDEGLSVAQEARKSLENGKSLSDELLVEAVILITSRINSQGKGWVLDGFPQTLKQAQLLENQNFRPHLFFEIQLDTSNVNIRAEADFRAQIAANQIFMNHCDIVKLREENNKSNMSELRSLYLNQYKNWILIDGTKSKWAVKAECAENILKACKLRQLYVSRKAEGLAAPVNNLGLSCNEISVKTGKFREYCPVSFVEHGQLIETNPNASFIAEYKDGFYHLASDEMLCRFLKNPEKYFDVPLPKKLPEPTTKESIKFPQEIELKGYCAVTFAQNPGAGFKGIIPGSYDFLVNYDQKVYSLCSQDCFDSFMRTPWLFENLNLPEKLPPPIKPIDVSSLPIIGYLEQTVSRILTESLTSVGNFRPKHPFKSSARSACEYVGLFLKANNAKSKDYVRKSFEKRLSKFKNDCTLIPEISSHLRQLPDLKEKSLNALSGEFEQFLNFASLKPQRLRSE